MQSVLVVSHDHDFLNELGDALRGNGMLAICVEELDAANEVMDEGFRPEAMVIDLALVLEPGGDERVRYLAGTPALTTIPVLSISSVMRRPELQELLATLRRKGEGGDAHP